MERHRTGPALREHIAAVAARLFYRDGIGMSGVDRIADAAGVTKRTLYRYFPSKDLLIAASLRGAPIMRFPEHGDPVERILGAFAAVDAFLRTSEFRGCPYVFYAAELTDRTHPARTVIERRLAKRRAWFRDRAAEAGLTDPDAVAERLDLLLDGALASGAKRSDVAAADAALDVARLVVDAARPTGPVLKERLGVGCTSSP